MSQHNAKAVYEAIKEAVENAVSLFGVDGVRKLSMFPSSEENKDQKEAA
jgi:hypothetical protein